MTYLVHVLNIAVVFGILAASLNLMAGYTGMVSVAHAAFFGIGAYVHGVLSLRCGTSLPVNAVVAMFFGGVMAVGIGKPLRTLRGDTFVMGTFALQVLVFSVFNNFSDLTGGPMGLPGIPRLAVFSNQSVTPLSYLVLCLAVLAVVLVFIGAVVSSPIGRVLRGMREDPILAEAVGKNTGKYCVDVFTISGAMAALAGVLYAGFIGFVDPTSFTVTESILVLSMVIIGGAGNLWGPVLGSLVLVAIPELLRYLGLPPSVSANLRQIIYGALLVLVVLLRPQGILGRSAFGREAKAK